MRIRCRILTVGFLLLLSEGAMAQDLKITKGPVVEGANANSVVIAWSTNAASSTLVKYGTDPHALNQTAETPWGSLTHRVTIKNLEPGKVYYFQVISGQAQGTSTTAVSQVRTFATAAATVAGTASPMTPQLQITSGPLLQRIGDTWAVVVWSTNLPSSSTVEYGTDPSNLTGRAQEPWGATAHRVELKSLRPGTRYYFQVHSGEGQNAPGETAQAGPIAFTTAAEGQQARTRSH